MIFQVPIGRATVFHWTPHYLPDPNAANPSVKFVSNGQTVTQALTNFGSSAISGVPDRYSLTAGAANADLLGGFVGDIGGNWYLYLTGFGQFAVTVSHFDDTAGVYRLAEPLPHGIPSNADGSLIHNQWYTDIAADALGDTIDRTGYYEIEYTQDPDMAGANAGKRIFTDRGLVRVVRSPFSTGLTAATLKTLVPQIEGTRPPNRDSWQALIDELDVIGEIEARLPAGSYADQTVGSQFRRFQALSVAGHIAEVGYAPNVDSERMRELASNELDRQIARVHWLDSDGDGVIDSGETDYAAGGAWIKQTLSSAVTTSTDYTNGDRYRPRLDDYNDR